MRKLCLTVIGFYMMMLSAFSQEKKPDSSYHTRKLKIDEINILGSYYSQDGDNAAVLGGRGSQKLTNIANTMDIRLTKYDRKDRKNIFDIDLGIDSYTSASSDSIDPKTMSSASANDTRYYPSLSWSRENEVAGTTIGAGVSTSFEYDYNSYGFNVNVGKKTKDRSGEFTAKLQAYLDKVLMILPIELRGLGRYQDGGYKKRNSFSSSFTYSQIVNERLQLMLLLDLVYQQGYLGLPFNRVYFNDNSVNVEQLPDKRFKLPIGIRANYFAGDKIILRGYYRYYIDDWGLNAHTAELEMPVKITPFFSVSPFYRFYVQNGTKYFAPYKTHTDADDFYTSNYDLSSFTSHFLGAGVRMTPPNGIFGLTRWSMVEMRYGYYKRNNSLSSHVVSAHLRFRKD